MSDKIQTSVAELEDRWSFDGLMMAHDLLDVLEEAEARQMAGLRRG